MKTMGSFARLALVLGLAFGAVGGARAEPPQAETAPPAEAAPEAEAARLAQEDGAFGTIEEQVVEHLKAARQHFNAGQYEQAIRRLEAAYGLSPKAQYLFSIAQSHRRLGHHREARDMYRRFLRDAPKEKAGLRLEATSYIRELDVIIAKIEAEEREKRRPLAKQRWFWAVLGSVAAAGAAAGVVAWATTRPPGPESITFTFENKGLSVGF